MENYRFEKILVPALALILSFGYIGLCAGLEKVFSPEGYRLAVPGYQFNFPRDHAAHPEFRTEWWYFTGHLTANSEKEPSFGYEMTFFRTALTSKPKVPESRWNLRDVYFAHFAISDFKNKKFWFSEKISRGALGLAGTEENNLNVWIEKWTLKQETDHSWRLNASQDDFTLDLILNPTKPEVVHGRNGVSQKSEGIGKATHYVSFTRMETKGRLTIPGRKAFDVSGQSWYDHEFGSNQLSSDQVGWDWFSLQFTSGEELMVYLLRKKDGCFDKASSGTWIDAKGQATHLPIEEISIISKAQWKSPRTNTLYPSQWEVRVPKVGVSVTIEPLLADQELALQETGKMSYWEGACLVKGSHSGRAYVELTGYDHQLTKSPLSGKAE